MANYTVEHVSKRRFELHNEKGKSLGYLDYHEGVGSLHLDFVFVEPDFRGQGVGIDIVKEAMKLAKEKNLTPKPICTYASTIMKRNNWPEEFND